MNATFHRQRSVLMHYRQRYYFNIQLYLFPFNWFCHAHAVCIFVQFCYLSSMLWKRLVSILSWWNTHVSLEKPNLFSEESKVVLNMIWFPQFHPIFREIVHHLSNGCMLTEIRWVHPYWILKFTMATVLSFVLNSNGCMLTEFLYVSSGLLSNSWEIILSLERDSITSGYCERCTSF
jgi:hypothetical protein